MNTIIRLCVRSSVLGLIMALAACGREDQRVGDTTAAAGGDTAAAGGMKGMQGMGGGMEQMQAHMRMMETDNADSLRGMLSMHRQMVANMISQMNREMRDMNVPGDAAWTATMDSIRQDLVRLPDMRGAELREFFPAHRTRVMRLVEAHRAMMRSMNR